MSLTEIEKIESENLASAIVATDFLTKSSEKEKYLKPCDIAGEEVDMGHKTPQSPTVISMQHICGPHPTLAQETPEEYTWRLKQVQYERNGSYAKNMVLAKSINTLAEKNFTNRLLVAACNFSEMAENYTRSVFIRNFGPLIEEELKADPTQPSKRLASFATTYFWKEGNMQRMALAVPPDVSRDELLEFFKLPLNSEPDKKIIDCLPNWTTGEILDATKNPENKTIKFDFRRNFPSVSLDESEKLEKSITELARQNFTNRLLTSTIYFRDVINPFNSIRVIKEFGPTVLEELQLNSDKPSATLASLITEKGLTGEDVQTFLKGVTPETTKKELSEFFTTRENWSTNLRMIDYLNHHVVMEMTRFLPNEDRLDIWFLRPELANGIHVENSLKKLSSESQKKILDTVKDPVRKKALQEGVKSELVGFHITAGFHDVYRANPYLLDIPAQFSAIRQRRICSHEDNRAFFTANKNYRSSFER